MDCLGKMQDGGERMTYDHDGAMREPSTGKGRYDLMSPFALQRIALWYELGAQKYAPRNWEKGIPFSRCIDSAKRHIDKFLMGMTDEDHLAAACWNIMAIMHYQMLEMHEFDDLPRYGKIDKVAQSVGNDVVFKNRDEAEKVLNAMRDMINSYGSISVADYYELSGLMAGTADMLYIWDNLYGVEIVATNGGYKIDLPRAKRRHFANKEENN